jgi:hypothetical protein
MQPSDNPGTIAVGSAILLPQNGSSSGGAVIRLSSSQFTLVAAGSYQIDWVASITEAGQLQLAIGGVGLPNTVVGRATAATQIVGSTVITTGAGAVLSVINPVGNASALTVSPNAGGALANPVSASLTIQRLA